eukprot:16126582-Heterocapsa_arctica.AAC.1
MGVGCARDNSSKSGGDDRRAHRLVRVSPDHRPSEPTNISQLLIPGFPRGDLMLTRSFDFWNPGIGYR